MKQSVIIDPAIDISTYMKSTGALIEKELDQLVPLQNVLQNNLYSAARYSLLAGGKRLRPILALATAETLGGNIENALVPACALEMIHTYSLIHDDLPSMDNDDFRRGKPSLHKAFPEGHAILTGDYLLTYAFEILSTAKNLSSDQRIQLISILSRRSGSEGMIGGQVLDLESEGKPIDFSVLKTIHRYKTGALLLASIEFGAIVADASVDHMRLLQNFGSDIGLAFQIVDDILDVTASEQKHGKKVASDITNNKSTYVSLLGLEKSQDMANQLYDSALANLELIPTDTSLLKGIAQLIVKQAKI